MVNGGPQLELSTSKALRVWTSQTAPRQIQLRFVDRVLPNVGLCIEFYNFVSIKDAIIYPGDGQQSCGEAYIKVEFNLIVFQPLIDEWLVRS
eukprot:s2327_g1.t1